MRRHGLDVEREAVPRRGVRRRRGERERVRLEVRDVGQAEERVLARRVREDPSAVRWREFQMDDAVRARLAARDRPGAPRFFKTQKPVRGPVREAAEHQIPAARRVPERGRVDREEAVVRVVKDLEAPAADLVVREAAHQHQRRDRRHDRQRNGPVVRAAPRALRLAVRRVVHGHLQDVVREDVEHRVDFEPAARVDDKTREHEVAQQDVGPERLFPGDTKRVREHGMPRDREE